jgi:hypothetical protein
VATSTIAVPEPDRCASFWSRGGSCLFDDHQIWWRVEADSADDALGRLPWYVAVRTIAIPIAEVPIP